LSLLLLLLLLSSSYPRGRGRVIICASGLSGFAVAFPSSSAPKARNRERERALGKRLSTWFFFLSPYEICVCPARACPSQAIHRIASRRSRLLRRKKRKGKERKVQRKGIDGERCICVRVCASLPFHEGHNHSRRPQTSCLCRCCHFYHLLLFVMEHELEKKRIHPSFHISHRDPSRTECVSFSLIMSCVEWVPRSSSQPNLFRLGLYTYNIPEHLPGAGW
jgi:hypothetical protein